ncbi:uncharacterized protein LOC120634101 [Pararge aegeria]|uniref:uncharacterized protein LOC120634101 n=2 Tax=Pararge aegeria TaxID=116150 RepID=UPI0019D31B9B|nr:uncharacterized protein LOC120634101 [Pararge aegeria]
MFYSHHQEIKRVASSFENAHYTILEILDDTENDESELQERFDEMYYKVISIYRGLNNNEPTSPSRRSSFSNVRLPKIQLPTFDGDVKRFPEYFDTFNALIHNSTSLSNSEKFHYLVSSLSGDAMTVVKTFPLSSEYYCDAYDALVARYKCKRELAFTYLHVLSKICGDQPIANLNTSGWSHIKALPLADPGFDIPGSIDLLFAADVFADSLLNQQIKGGPSQPTAFNSIFGWLLLGKTRIATTTMLQTLETDCELNSLVQRFWELDSLPKTPIWTPEESLCEQKFISDHTRDDSGRYILCLPFKDDSEPSFIGSRDVALRRFHAIERRLSRDSDLHSQYLDFMSDYIKNGHMSLVPADEMEKGKYYIPHHSVLRPDSATTRLRVVFDASAKDFNSRSLNDTQLIGPKLQPNILEILLRFREHNIVFMADVRQMYRQILIAPNHRDYQRIFWRASPHEPLKEYRLNTVTYGVASSPFLACRSLQRLAEDEGESYPIAKRILLSDVYVDDVVTGCASLEDAQQAKSQIIALFNRGCFQLRKWVSNKSELLSDLPAEVCLTGTVSLDESDSKTLKVLGLKWDPTSDSFLFEIKAIDRICTKRSILSELARIFDPLGFLSPVTIHAKSLIQKLWILGIGWDQTPPDEVIRAWNTYQTQLLQLSQLRIPRKITCENVRSYELHGFADSSETAYGAVIFLRVTDAKGQVRVFLVCSKARVVPLKRISLPRLELCAAVLLSDLYLFVRDSYLSRISFDATYFWSDSTVVLSWLRSPATRWATFVANRVSHIQSITTIECWHHILSGDNPADICSRGQFPNEILHNSLWWTGPQWLSQDRDSWPSSLGTTSPDEGVIVNMEARKLVALVTELHNSERIDEPTVSFGLFLLNEQSVTVYPNACIAIGQTQSPFNRL